MHDADHVPDGLETPLRTRSSRLAIIRLALLVTTVICLIVLFALMGTSGVRVLLTEVGESRWGVAAFVAVYAIGVVLLIPGTLGTLTAGAVFGFPLGGFAALVGASIGATIAFAVSRVMGRDGARLLFGDRLTSIDDFLGRNDFVSILVLRLMPVVPFNVLNYGSGLSAVRASRYVGATVIGIAPATFLTTALADQADEPTGAPFLILLGLFLAMLVGSAAYGRRVQAARRV